MSTFSSTWLIRSVEERSLTLSRLFYSVIEAGYFIPETLQRLEVRYSTLNLLLESGSFSIFTVFKKSLHLSFIGVNFGGVVSLSERALPGAA